MPKDSRFIANVKELAAEKNVVYTHTLDDFRCFTDQRHCVLFGCGGAPDGVLHIWEGPSLEALSRFHIPIGFYKAASSLSLFKSEVAQHMESMGYKGQYVFVFLDQEIIYSKKCGALWSPKQQAEKIPGISRKAPMSVFPQVPGEDFSKRVVSFITDKLDLFPGSIGQLSSIHQAPLNYIDSICLVELVMALEKEYQCEITDEEAGKLETVQDIIDLVRPSAPV